jgi:uncharacterized peroxidase-related enzyme
VSPLEPLRLDEVPGLEDLGRMYQSVFGFVPNSLRVMARRPAIVSAYASLRRAVMDPDGTVPLELKNLIGHIASRTAGCRYCQAHTIFGASRSGSDPARLQELWDFETSEYFTAAERAALAFAAAAAAVPNAVDEAALTRLRSHWDDGQVVEIVAVVALFGFLNRWNDSLATPLEEPSRAVAETLLGRRGWQPGKHLAG